MGIIEQLNEIQFLGFKLLNTHDFASLLIRLGIDLVFAYIIISRIYFGLKKDKDYLFTLYVFNILIFLVCYFMNSVKLSMGFAFGLFALFSILRYRTITVPIKEMTYLFTVIVLAVINALSTGAVSLVELLFTNLLITGIILLLEKVMMKVPQGFKLITYENIALIKPEKSKELMEDLRSRTGLDITEVDVDSINFLNDTALIKIFYNRHQSSGISSRVVEGKGRD